MNKPRSIKLLKNTKFEYGQYGAFGIDFVSCENIGTLLIGPKEAKRLHEWLGRVVKYAEQDGQL